MFYSTLSAELFQESFKYPRYDQYNEERMSYIDDDKNIVVHDFCINLSDEDNSQYIPFEMDRYYQGVDLMEMTLQIHFVNAQMESNYATPINVSYSDSRIRFGWLVDRNVTHVVGKLLFEVQAIGTIQSNDGSDDETYGYVWKTRTNSQITILKSLLGTELFEPTEDWYVKLVAAINNQNNLTQDYMEAAKLSEQNAKASENASAQNATVALNSQEASKQSEINAEQSAINSSSSAILAQSWAVGGTGSREDEDTNNAKYWSQTTNSIRWLDFKEM